MAKKPKRISSKSSGPRKFSLTAGQQRKQDNAAMRETGRNPKGFRKMSPAAQARAILAMPVVGGPSSGGSSGGLGNWRTQPRDPRTGRWVKR